MFARHVTIPLKPEVAHEFPLLAEKLQKDILPLLRKQKGFIEELFPIAPKSE
jgi:hypothetical protein